MIGFVSEGWFMKKWVIHLMFFGMGVFLFSGCASVQQRIDHTELETGMRIEDGRLTDEPKVSVPVWTSGGFKEKRKDLSPRRP